MSNKTKYSIDSKGFYGEFGGAYVPEILYKCVTDLQQAYLPIIESDSFSRNTAPCCATMWAARRRCMRLDA